MDKNQYNKISKIILEGCLAVHKEMGPGLLESVYELCLFQELVDRNLKVKNQVTVPLSYKGQILSKEYKIDLLVEDEIVIELKSVEHLLPVHEAQIISYLKLANKKLGFLVNFNVHLIKDGFKRFVNNF